MIDPQTEVLKLRERLAEMESEVAKRKQAEEALEKSEKRLRTIFQHSNDSIFLVDVEDEAIPLGHAFAHHIIDHGFDPDYYRKIDIKNDVDYVLMRMRQTHDIWHVVTGIGTDPVGELGLKAPGSPS